MTKLTSIKKQIDQCSTASDAIHLIGNILVHDTFEDYTYQFLNATHILKKNQNIVYKESDQHVVAVCKLMQIPKELWIVWALFTVNAANEKSVVLIPLKERLKLFKFAAEKTLIPYLESKTSIKNAPLNCLLCHSVNFFKPVSKHTPHHDVHVFICKTCGLGMRFPRDTKQALSKIYEDENYFTGKNTEHGYFDYVEEEGWRLEKAKKYLANLDHLMKEKPSYALDIGSGFGYFLRALEEKNYRAMGIELSKDAANIANKKGPSKTLHGDLRSLFEKRAIGRDQFSLITLWDVIEHFYDFNEDLDIVSAVLSSKGYVALRTNNIESIEFDVLGPYFHSIKHEHTFYFTSSVLERIFKKNFIRPVKIWTHTHLFLAFMTKKEINEINTSNRGGDIFFLGQKQ